MKQFLLAVAALFVISGTASAQESYTTPVGAQNVVKVNRARLRWNAAVCARYALSATCTQAQVCVPAGVAGGASCTAAAARAVDVEIFANTQPGRELYFIHQLLVKLVVPSLQSSDVIDDITAQQRNWTLGNDTVKNAMCLAAGAPVPATVVLGCNLYP